MQYLLHAPSRADIFITGSQYIAFFLRHHHRWSVIESESEELPEYISTLSIFEREDGTIGIDGNVLDSGCDIVAQICGKLQRDGFVDPDVEYVGLLIRPVCRIGSGVEGRQAVLG